MSIRVLLIFIGACTTLAMSCALGYFFISVTPPSVPTKLSVPPVHFRDSGYHGDGAVWLLGQVFEWHDSDVGCSSVAYVDEVISHRFKTSPLKNARIALFAWPREDAKIAEGSSNRTGNFEFGRMIAPGRFDLGLVISKTGFQRVTKVFHHDRVQHRVEVFMCREDFER